MDLWIPFFKMITDQGKYHITAGKTIGSTCEIYLLLDLLDDNWSFKDFDIQDSSTLKILSEN